MTDKDFDKRIGDALRGYEEEPPRELFQRIEETLAAAGAAPRKRQRIRHAYGYAVAAALLVLVAALVFGAVVHSQLAYYYATPYYR